LLFWRFLTTMTDLVSIADDGDEMALMVRPKGVDNASDARRQMRKGMVAGR
jgi:hypothetical protein